MICNEWCEHFTSQFRLVTAAEQLSLDLQLGDQLIAPDHTIDSMPLASLLALLLIAVAWSLLRQNYLSHGDDCKT